MSQGAEPPGPVTRDMPAPRLPGMTSRCVLEARSNSRREPHLDNMGTSTDVGKSVWRKSIRRPRLNKGCRFLSEFAEQPIRCGLLGMQFHLGQVIVSQIPMEIQEQNLATTHLEMDPDST